MPLVQLGAGSPHWGHTAVPAGGPRVSLGYLSGPWVSFGVLDFPDRGPLVTLERRLGMASQGATRYPHPAEDSAGQAARVGSASQPGWNLAGALGDGRVPRVLGGHAALTGAITPALSLSF